MIRIQQRALWHHPLNYETHHIVRQILHAEQSFHKIAISNHNSVDVSNIRLVWSFDGDDMFGFDLAYFGLKYRYYFKLNEYNKPLFHQKVKLA